MRRVLFAAMSALALTSGCHNFSTDNTGSQTISYDDHKGQFVPANDGGFMNGEPMDMRRK